MRVGRKGGDGQPQPKFDLTDEQRVILAAARGSRDNLLISALAGAAKTTTLRLIAEELKEDGVCLAFNKRIAEELQSKFPSWVKCATMNSLGHRAWAKAITAGIRLDIKKSDRIIEDVARELRNRDFDFYAMKQLLSLAKQAGYTPSRGAGARPGLVKDREAWLVGAEVIIGEKLPSNAVQVLDLALNRTITQGYAGLIDFEDQIFLSTLYGGVFDTPKVVYADELQDASPLNHALIARLASSGARVIAVGDAKQAIYRWRGADSAGMNTMRVRFNMKVLELTTTFRCARAIVEHARGHPPKLKARPDAPEGSVEFWGEWNAAQVPEGAAVICRNNAPLLSLGLKLLREGVGVNLVGAGLQGQFLKDLGSLGAPEMGQPDALTAISIWKLKRERGSSPEAAEAIEDRAECLRAFVLSAPDLEGALAATRRIFNSSGRVHILSGHKAKGLEWETVIHLDPWRIPSNYARKDPEAMQQEANLAYVISTRARNRLIHANLSEFKPKEERE